MRGNGPAQWLWTASVFIPYLSCRIVFYSAFLQGVALDMAALLLPSGATLNVEEELWLLPVSGINGGGKVYQVGG